MSVDDLIDALQLVDEPDEYSSSKFTTTTDSILESLQHCIYQGLCEGRATALSTLQRDVVDQFGQSLNEDTLHGLQHGVLERVRGNLLKTEGFISSLMTAADDSEQILEEKYRTKQRMTEQRCFRCRSGVSEGCAPVYRT